MPYWFSPGAARGRWGFPEMTTRIEATRLNGRRTTVTLPRLSDAGLCALVDAMSKADVATIGPTATGLTAAQLDDLTPASRDRLIADAMIQQAEDLVVRAEDTPVLVRACRILASASRKP